MKGWPGLSLRSPVEAQGSSTVHRDFEDSAPATLPRTGTGLVEFGIPKAGTMDVFSLSYLLPLADGHWRGMSVGHYSSEWKAKRAIERLKHQPGFRDFPEGFRIHRITLDEDNPEEGFFER